MIQRIQSIYLLIASVFSGGLIFIFDLWKNNGNDFFAIDGIHTSDIWLKLITIFFVLSSALSLITIFIFKNRKLQFVLNRINILINFLLLAILIYVSQNLSGEPLVSEKGIGLIIPIFVVVLLVIANKAIKKDEDLVKSVDRLR